MTDCPLNGRGQGHMSNLYILVLENFITASRLVYWCDNKLIDCQLVDCIYDDRASRGWMYKFIIHRLTVTLSLHYFDLFWISYTSFSYTAVLQFAVAVTFFSLKRFYKYLFYAVKSAMLDLCDRIYDMKGFINFVHYFFCIMCKSGKLFSCDSIVE